jgi:hypothetical protein
MVSEQWGQKTHNFEMWCTNWLQSTLKVSTYSESLLWGLQEHAGKHAYCKSYDRSFPGCRSLQ